MIVLYACNYECTDKGKINKKSSKSQQAFSMRRNAKGEIRPSTKKENRKKVKKLEET
jgi:hypothetical protein